MKTTKKMTTWVAVVAALLMIALPTTGRAQLNDNCYFNMDWQFNIPLSNNFSDQASGWGMNFEGGCNITHRVALGLFINYHTNNEYIPRRTIDLSSSSAVTTDQQHSLFQLPFGVGTRINLGQHDMFKPYVGLKLGAEYCQLTSYYNIFASDDNTWGFYLSPEVGTTIYPMRNKSFGFHLAIYYSYATNRGKLFTTTVDNLNNLGFRVGLAF